MSPDVVPEHQLARADHGAGDDQARPQVLPAVPERRWRRHALAMPDGVRIECFTGQRRIPGRGLL